MAKPIYVVDSARRHPATRGPRYLSSREALVGASKGTKDRQIWVLRNAETVADLFRAMTATASRVGRTQLISYARPSGVAAQVLESSFAGTLVRPRVMVAFRDLTEILGSAHPEDYCVAAEWDRSTHRLAMWRGDLSVLLVPLSAFPTRGGITPTPSKLSIEDCGQTLRLGAYEASVESLLEELDPKFRRRSKKRMIRELRTLGASIRRLRLLRQVRRTEFPGLDEKTVARIERDEVEHPHRTTLEAIATRLAVTIPELEDY